MNVKSTLLLGIILMLGGCAAPVRVPSGAQLIWYGRLDQSGSFPLPSTDGQVYIVNDAGRVISVMPAGKPATSPVILPMHETFSVYFVKRAGMSATQPTTRNTTESNKDIK